MLIGNRHTTAAITTDCTVNAIFNAVGKQNQTLTFAALADQVWGTPLFPVSAAASSGINSDQVRQSPGCIPPEAGAKIQPPDIPVISA